MSRWSRPLPAHSLGFRLSLLSLWRQVLLAFAQQGVRLWKHCYAMPDSLCPWDVGLPGGDAYTAKAFSDLINF